MRIERGIWSKKAQINLILQSENGDSHSVMSDQAEIFESIADEVRDFATKRLRLWSKVQENLGVPGAVVFDVPANGQVRETPPLRSRIGLAVEAPPSMLWATRREGLTELDYAIGHRVLEDKDYAAYFAARPAGRECILDNSFHELGKSISMDDLLRASDLIHPDYVIAPDQLDDVSFVVQGFDEMSEAFHKRGMSWKRAFVLSGKTQTERENLINACKDAEMLCLPYDRPRYLWYLELFPFWKRVHLLGVSELPELLAWLPLTNALHLTVDTGKPVKRGLMGEELSQLRSWRRALLKSKELLEQTQELREDTRALVLKNVAYLAAQIR